MALFTKIGLHGAMSRRYPISGKAVFVPPAPPPPSARPEQLPHTQRFPEIPLVRRFRVVARIEWQSVASVTVRERVVVPERAVAIFDLLESWAVTKERVKLVSALSAAYSLAFSPTPSPTRMVISQRIHVSLADRRYEALLERALAAFRAESEALLEKKMAEIREETASVLKKRGIMDETLALLGLGGES